MNKKCIQCNINADLNLSFYDTNDDMNAYCLQCANNNINKLLEEKRIKNQEKRREMQHNCNHDFQYSGYDEAQCEKCNYMINIDKDCCYHNYETLDDDKSHQYCKICNHTIYKDLP